MTINDLWLLCERVRKGGQGFTTLRIYRRSDQEGGVLYGPYQVDVARVDPQTGEVTLEVTSACPECGRPS